MLLCLVRGIGCVDVYSLILLTFVFSATPYTSQLPRMPQSGAASRKIVTMNDEDDDNNGEGDGMLDEAAERRAFQAAVAEWRSGGTTTATAADTAAASGGTKAKVSSTSSTTAAATAGSTLVPRRPVTIKDSDLESSPQRAHAPGGKARKAAVGDSGGLLATGELDEEKEHAVRTMLIYCYIYGT
jgi:hypothetical protein